MGYADLNFFKIWFYCPNSSMIYEGIGMYSCNVFELLICVKFSIIFN